MPRVSQQVEKKRMPKTKSHSEPLKRREVVALCGDITDDQVAAILSSGATREELEEALAWAALEDDVMLAEHKPMAGRPAEIYEILTSDDAAEDQERR